MLLGEEEEEEGRGEVLLLLVVFAPLFEFGFLDSFDCNLENSEGGMMVEGTQQDRLLNSTVNCLSRSMLLSCSCWWDSPFSSDPESCSTSPP